MEQTLGEKRVRKEQRPLELEEVQAVNDFKDHAAKFIDACEELKATGSPERARLVAIAQTKMEEAVMFAVKAVTE